MGTLYVIGNGLDLHFGLETSINHFKAFLAKECIPEDMENARWVFEGLYGVDWSEYEQALAGIDLEVIYENHMCGPDYLSDHESDREGTIWEMHSYLSQLNNAVHSALKEMVRKANEAVEKFRNAAAMDAAAEVIVEAALDRDLSRVAEIVCQEYKDPLHMWKPISLFQSGDAILSFNYTSTIEALFDLPEDVPICHLHGYFEASEDLIFGYRRMQNSPSPSWTDLSENDGDSYLQRQREEIYQFYEGWEKELQESRLEQFLKQCGPIQRVVVLGHSMGAVDAPYMERIDAVLQPKIWEISYYENELDCMGNPQQIDVSYSFQKKVRRIPFTRYVPKQGKLIQISQGDAWEFRMFEKISQ